MNPTSVQPQQSRVVNSTRDPAQPQPQWDVFVSHRGPDTKWNFVEDMKRELPGRRVFLDMDDLHVGAEGWEQILQALTTARIVLVVISPGFQSSAWCLEELRIALLRRHTVRLVYWDTGHGQVDEGALLEALKDYRASIPQHQSPARSSATVIAAWRAALLDAAGIVARLHKSSF